MDIGFIGLGKMGFPMARRLVEAGHKLIVHDHLTISTNLFGTTYYSLVGLHASHVIVGLLMMLVTLVFALAGAVGPQHAYRVKTLALYWHFVDAVWVVVFTLVYLVGR